MIRHAGELIKTLEDRNGSFLKILILIQVSWKNNNRKWTLDWLILIWQHADWPWISAQWAQTGLVGSLARLSLLKNLTSQTEVTEVPTHEWAEQSMSEYTKIWISLHACMDLHTYMHAWTCMHDLYAWLVCMTCMHDLYAWEPSLDAIKDNS